MEVVFILNFPLLHLVLNNREEDFTVTQQGTIKKAAAERSGRGRGNAAGVRPRLCAKCGGCGGLKPRRLRYRIASRACVKSATACCSRARPGRCSGFTVLYICCRSCWFFVGHGVGAGNENSAAACPALIGGVLFVVGILAAMVQPATRLKLSEMKRRFAITTLIQRIIWTLVSFLIRLLF